MTEIRKAYRQKVPGLRFIGKKYGEGDRTNGGFGRQWGEWFQNGWFDTLEKAYGGWLGDIYEDGDGYIGLMRWKEGEPFEYWIGMFLPPDTPVPEGFESLEFPADTLGVCWLYGPEGELYGKEHLCAARLEQEGYTIARDGQGAFWFFERYVCPRFTTPDAQGNVILDICHYVK